MPMYLLKDPKWKDQLQKGLKENFTKNDTDWNQLPRSNLIGFINPAEGKLFLEEDHLLKPQSWEKLSLDSSKWVLFSFKPSLHPTVDGGERHVSRKAHTVFVDESQFKKDELKKLPGMLKEITSLVNEIDSTIPSSERLQTNRETKEEAVTVRQQFADLFIAEYKKRYPQDKPKKLFAASKPETNKGMKELISTLENKPKDPDALVTILIELCQSKPNSQVQELCKDLGWIDSKGVVGAGSRTISKAFDEAQDYVAQVEELARITSQL